MVGPRRLRELISAANFSRRRGGHVGQISTFMLLMIAGVLVLALATANMGKLAVNATTGSNAADSAALLLASQLATKSYQLWDSLKGKPDDHEGQFKKCQSKSLLGIILAIIVAIIIIVVSWGSLTPAAIAAATGVTAATAAMISMVAFMVVGAIGGMIGGAIGGGIDGGLDGALAGALQGMQIGMAIGGLASMAAPGGVAAASGSGAGAGAAPVGLFGQAMQGVISVARGIVSAVRTAMSYVQTAVNWVVNGIGQALGIVGPATATTGAAGANLGALAGSLPSTMPVSTGTTVVAGEAGTMVDVIGAGGEVLATSGATPLAAGEAFTVPLVPLNSTMMVTNGMVMAPALTMPTAATFGALTAGAAIYNGYVADKMLADAMADIAKATSGLRERDRIREQTFYAALSQSVTDPNWTSGPGHPDGVCHWMDEHVITGDPDDIDLDGDTTEAIPCFQYFWFKRIEMFKKRDADQKAALAGTVKKILQAIDALTLAMYDTHELAGGAGPVWWTKTPLPQLSGSLFSRDEIEGKLAGCTPYTCEEPVDGALIKVARAFEVGYTGPAGKTRSYPVSFWDEGPGLAELQRWEKELAQGDCDDEEYTCDGKTLPDSYDDIDSMITQMQAFEYLNAEIHAMDTNDLARSLEAWLPWFYEPAQAGQKNDSYYYTLSNYVDPYSEKQIGFTKRLTSWRDEITTISALLPACNVSSPGGCVTWHGITTCTPATVANPPCKMPSGQVVISATQTDDFAQARKLLNAFIADINRFRRDIKTLYESINWADAAVDEAWGGTNPGTYRWTDSGGPHYVSVQISPLMKIPKLDASSSFTKTCMKLEDYEDPNGDRTWVRITMGDTKLGETTDPEQPGDQWDWDAGPQTIQKRAKAGFRFITTGSKTSMWVGLRSTNNE